jgi:uncharacterized protein YkwD
MTRLGLGARFGFGFAFIALAASQGVRADALSVIQLLREGGCGGILPYARPLHHHPFLDRAAERWSEGGTVADAVERSGYQAEASTGLRVSGLDAGMVQSLRRSACGSIGNPEMHDIGVFHRGADSWIVLGSAYVIPGSAAAPALVTRALALVNEARSRGARCGGRSFAPVPPVTLSGKLADVALGHASDMAEHNYFEHEDLTGRTPADRVRATGYREKLVGENIAYGPKSADEVVQGWLDSPGHCENIMDPRFAEMGIAYAPGRSSRRGLYWVQLLAAPRA